MDTLKADVCALPPGRLCEGPVWDPRTRELLWVDIRAGLIHRAGLTTTPTPDLLLRATSTLNPPVSAVLPCASGQLLATVGDTIFRIDSASADDLGADYSARHSGALSAGTHTATMDPDRKPVVMADGQPAGAAGGEAGASVGRGSAGSAGGTGVSTLSPVATVAFPGDGAPRRFNDAKVDPRGRLLAGTMVESGAPGTAALYRLDPDGTLTTLRTGVTISNGLGWSPDGRTLYYADSPTHRVEAIDYDLDTGTLGAARPFAHFEDGEPDGLTVDAEGNVWVAVWGAGQVRAFDPAGTHCATVEVGPSQVSSCTFAGPDLDVLVITTAAEGEAAREPLAGRLFTCVPGATGLPATLFADMRPVAPDGR